MTRRVKTIQVEKGCRRCEECEKHNIRKPCKRNPIYWNFIDCILFLERNEFPNFRK